jgi:hypothetical protein
VASTSAGVLVLDLAAAIHVNMAALRVGEWDDQLCSGVTFNSVSKALNARVGRTDAHSLHGFMGSTHVCPDLGRLPEQEIAVA